MWQKVVGWLVLRDSATRFPRPAHTTCGFYDLDVVTQRCLYKRQVGVRRDEVVIGRDYGGPGRDHAVIV